MKIPKEEYKEAEGYLKRYNYNSLNILSIRSDIIGLRAVCIDDMPKAPYRISDSVLDSVIDLQENEELNKSIKEYRIVKKSLELLNEDCKNVFNRLYELQKDKWEIIDELGFSEETYKRRKRQLIYTVHNEIKKLT